MTMARGFLYNEAAELTTMEGWNMDAGISQAGSLQVDLEKTKAYYACVRQEDLCDCPGCWNYRQRVKGAYPQMARYLETLGIDIEKPFHVSYVESREPHQMLYLSCCYVAFGESGFGFSRQVDGLEFTRAGACPDSGVEEPHLELQIPELTLPFQEEEGDSTCTPPLPAFTIN